MSLLELQLCFSQRFYTCRIFLGRRIAKGEHKKSNALTKTFLQSPVLDAVVEVEVTVAAENGSVADARTLHLRDNGDGGV